MSQSKHDMHKLRLRHTYVHALDKKWSYLRSDRNTVISMLTLRQDYDYG